MKSMVDLHVRVMIAAGCILIGGTLLTAAMGNTRNSGRRQVELAETEAFEAESAETETEHHGIIETTAFSQLLDEPEAMGIHDVRNATKIYFASLDANAIGNGRRCISVDLERRKVYAGVPIWAIREGKDTGSLRRDKKEMLLQILEEEDVQQWLEDYTDPWPGSLMNDADYSWILVLEYPDRTIETHQGRGTRRNAPENLDKFVERLHDLFL